MNEINEAVREKLKVGGCWWYQNRKNNIEIVTSIVNQHFGYGNSMPSMTFYGKQIKG